MIAKNDDWSYEATVAQVEDILEVIEGGDLSLSEALDYSEVLKGHLQQCDEFLGQMQGRADLLMETLGDRSHSEPSGHQV
jgi:exodeoxyribonuclease VII small subunit